MIEWFDDLILGVPAAIRSYSRRLRLPPQLSPANETRAWTGAGTQVRVSRGRFFRQRGNGPLPVRGPITPAGFRSNGALIAHPGQDAPSVALRPFGRYRRRSGHYADTANVSRMT